MTDNENDKYKSPEELDGAFDLAEFNDKKAKFLEQFVNYKAVISYACRAAGISRQTFYRWKSEDKNFREAVDDITEMQIDYVEAGLLENIRLGDTTAQIYYLKTKGKRRGWSEKIEVEHDLKDAAAAKLRESIAGILGVRSADTTSDSEGT